MATGVVIVVLNHFKCEKIKRGMIILSMEISIVTMLVLAITRAEYATSVAFILMIINERKHELYEEIFRDEFK